MHEIFIVTAEKKIPLQPLPNFRELRWKLIKKLFLSLYYSLSNFKSFYYFITLAFQLNHLDITSAEKGAQKK